VNTLTFVKIIVDDGYDFLLSLKTIFENVIMHFFEKALNALSRRSIFRIGIDIVFLIVQAFMNALTFIKIIS